MLEYFKSRLQKLKKLSRWSKFFILTSIVQAIITVILETRLLFRNEHLRQDLTQLNSTNPATTYNFYFPKLETANCKPGTVDLLTSRMKRIESENVIFIFFQLFQIWLNLDAIYRGNTIQLITIAIINFLCSAYSIIQLAEILIWDRKLLDWCHLDSLHLMNYDIPIIIVYMLFASLMGFLCYCLFREFKWDIYRKIGGDIKMQEMYKTYLIFILFLKIDIFFLLIFAIETWVTYLLQETDPSRKDIVPHVIVTYNKVITVLIVFSEIIGIISARKEWKIGMLIFFVFWIGVILDFIAILYSSVKWVSTDNWYFLIIFLSVGVILTIFTFIWGVFVYLNFGNGLKDIFKGKTGEPGKTGKNPFIIEEPNIFTIDDDA